MRRSFMVTPYVYQSEFTWNINSIHANISLHHKNVSLLARRLNKVSDTSLIRFFAIVQGPAIGALLLMGVASRRSDSVLVCWRQCHCSGQVLASSRRSMSPRPPNESSYRLKTTVVSFVLSFMCSSNYITLDFSRYGQIYCQTCMPSRANVFKLQWNPFMTKFKRPGGKFFTSGIARLSLSEEGN